MPPQGTHVRILLIRGFNTLTPPPYNQTTQNFGGYPSGGQQPPYPGQGGPSYPSGGGPAYPGNQAPYSSGPGTGPYPAGQGFQGYPGQQGPPPQYPVYPPKKKQDEKCCCC